MAEEYSSKNNIYRCCGYWCSMLACVGVYFWLVLFFMQATNSPYVIYEMEHIDSMTNKHDLEKIDTFKWSFLLTSILNVLCCFGCASCAAAIKPEPEVE